MTEKTRNILLIRFFKDSTTYTFENVIEEAISRKKESGDTLFSIDNHSDTATVNYAKTLLLSTGKAIVICHFEEDIQTLGSALPILNFAIRVPLTFYSNRNYMPIKPFVTKFSGFIYQTADELLENF